MTDDWVRCVNCPNDPGPCACSGGGIVPDADTRCAHQDAAGQCLDHQGHLGGHQPPTPPLSVSED